MNKYILTFHKAGPTLRINKDTLISYSWSNFKTPLSLNESERKILLQKRWTRFCYLASRFINNLAILREKDGKLVCVFKKGNPI